jgi:hypothetical protein
LLAAVLFDLENDTFRELLDAEGCRRRDRRIPRISLLTPGDTPFDKLYGSGNDPALITVTGFDHRTFRSLVELFNPWFLSHTPWTGSQDGTTFKSILIGDKCGGWKRIITSTTCLVLVLSWYRFRGSEFQLQGWFGFTGTHANVWLKFGRRGLLRLLRSHPMACVKMPTDKKIADLKAACEDKHPLLKDVYCVADGVKFYFKATETWMNSACTTTDGSVITLLAMCLFLVLTVSSLCVLSSAGNSG